MFERFTEKARQVVVLAQEEARGNANGSIGHEHLLGGLLREDEGIASLILRDFGVIVGDARAVYPPGDASATISNEQIPFTPEAKKVLELALREALSMGHNYIGTEHLLMAYVRAQGRVLSIDGDEIRDAVLRLLSGGGAEPPPPAEVVLPPGAGEFIEEIDALVALQVTLALRGFYTSVTTYRDAEQRPPGGTQKSMEHWHARLNVTHESLSSGELNLFRRLAEHAGLTLEWSMKHGATFRVKR